jgi:hypothetical protein
MSQEIAFYLDKAEEVTIETILNEITVTFLVVAPIYSDVALTNLIGSILIRKAVTGIVNGVATPESKGIYTYECFWNVPNVKGSSVFAINVDNELIKDGSTENIGTYYGGLDGIVSGGDFRNFGGSVRKIKDDTPIRKYLLKYSPFNPYNTLP